MQFRLFRARKQVRAPRYFCSKISQGFASPVGFGVPSSTVDLDYDPEGLRWVASALLNEVQSQADA